MVNDGEQRETFTLRVRRSTHLALIEQAEKRDVSVNHYTARLLDVIAKDNLFEAVLDDVGRKTKKTPSDSSTGGTSG